MIVDYYSLDVVVQEMVRMYEEALQVKLPLWDVPPPQAAPAQPAQGAVRKSSPFR
jgi:hypothetical protein